MQADVLHPSELTRRDLGAWRELQAATPAFASPLLGPDFAMAVGEVRADTRVAVLRRNREAVGFLPHQRRPTGFARPIGAPFSDYHALVSAPGERLSGPDVLGAARLSAFRFTGLIDPFGVFDHGAVSWTDAYQIEVDESAETYLERLSCDTRNRLKNYRRYHQKLERDLGPVRLVAHDASPAAFEQLLAWKSEQTRRTGVQDFLRAAWTRKLLKRLFESQTGAFRGLMVSLYAGETLVCGHFGVRLGDQFHPWIGSSDHDLRAHSPGMVHQWMAIEAMPALGLRTYDLGPGFDHWKRMFARSALPVGAGLATAGNPAGQLAGSFDKVWSLPLVGRLEAAGRLRRRLDQIAVTELSLGGRVHGLVNAIAGYERRMTSRTDRHPATA